MKVFNNLLLASAFGTQATRPYTTKIVAGQTASKPTKIVDLCVGSPYAGHSVWNTACMQGDTKKPTNIGNVKYLPSFSKEWKNIIYSYNKNNLKNLPINDLNINKLIKSYFDLYFKDRSFIGLTKFMRMKKRRQFLRRIFVSDIEVKHTNKKAKITLYTVNREKNLLKTKYNKILKKINHFLFEKYTFLHNDFLNSLIGITNKVFYLKKRYFFIQETIKKSHYINHKFGYLKVFLILNRLFLEKIWSIMIRNQYLYFVRLLKKYDLLYSLNQFKFNNKVLLPKISKLLWKLLSFAVHAGNQVQSSVISASNAKKIEYNIVNLKSIRLNTDIFTNVVALNIKKKRNKTLPWSMLGILNKVNLPNVNTIKERMRMRTIDNLDSFKNKYRDLKIISLVNSNNSNANINNLDELLNNVLGNAAVLCTDSNNVQNLRCSNDFFYKKKYKSSAGYKLPKAMYTHLYRKNNIFNSIHYKNIAGIRLEVKGRLTKRYRADRAICALKWKGGLKNIDSSFKGLSSVLFRGNTPSNISYTMHNSKRRIGAFAVKGWLSGK
jgi:hypothetical protein